MPLLTCAEAWEATFAGVWLCLGLLPKLIEWFLEAKIQQYILTMVTRERDRVLTGFLYGFLFSGLWMLCLNVFSGQTVCWLFLFQFSYNLGSWLLWVLILMGLTSQIRLFTDSVLGRGCRDPPVCLRVVSGTHGTYLGTLDRTLVCAAYGDHGATKSRFGSVVERVVYSNRVGTCMGLGFTVCGDWTNCDQGSSHRDHSLSGSGSKRRRPRNAAADARRLPS